MNNSTTHVIVGAGPIGSGTALRPAAAGHSVIIVTRSGSGPDHASIELVAADAADPFDPPSKKGAMRAQMWSDALGAHEAGRVRVTEARASDYFGPGLGQNGHFGDRVIPKLIVGKAVSVIGRSDVPHSWSYVGHVCDTLVVLGTDDRTLGCA